MLQIIRGFPQDPTMNFDPSHFSHFLNMLLRKIPYILVLYVRTPLPQVMCYYIQSSPFLFSLQYHIPSPITHTHTPPHPPTHTHTTSTHSHTTSTHSHTPPPPTHTHTLPTHSHTPPPTHTYPPHPLTHPPPPTHTYPPHPLTHPPPPTHTYPSHPLTHTPPPPQVADYLRRIFLCRWFWRGAVSTETASWCSETTRTVPYSGTPSPSLSYTTSSRYCREKRRSMLIR